MLILCAYSHIHKTGGNEWNVRINNLGSKKNRVVGHIHIQYTSHKMFIFVVIWMCVNTKKDSNPIKIQ